VTRLLEVVDLRTQFLTPRGRVHAVDGLSFSLDAGNVLGIVGESGCGKSVTALSLMGLLPARQAEIAGGSIRYAGRELTTLSRRELEDLRGHEIAMIFQDPMTSLNPTLTVGDQIVEPLRRHLGLRRGAVGRRGGWPL
jgi:ABC-type dipeptide/oligopeptide/nickel transport system ATPase component